MTEAAHEQGSGKTDLSADALLHTVSGVAEDISSGIGSIEAAWPVLTTATRIIRSVAGPKLGNELFEKFAALSKTDAFKQLSRFKPYQVARIVLALGCAAGPSSVSQDDLMSALRGVQNASRVEMQLRSKEIAPFNKEQENGAVQHFLDDVRPHVESIRAQFGESDNPIGQRALRFVFANLFISFENRIAAGRFEQNEEYLAKMPEMLGGPIGIDDLFPDTGQEKLVFGQQVALDDLYPDGTPKSLPIRENPARTEQYVAFKTKLFEIYNTQAFKDLQRRVGDTGVLVDYEVLIDPDLAPPELLAQVRERARVSDMFNLVNPKTLES